MNRKLELNIEHEDKEMKSKIKALNEISPFFRKSL